MSSIDPAQYAAKLTDYLRELEKSNVDGVVALFAPQATIYSPLLGWVSPASFYRKLADASGRSKITLLDLFHSSSGSRRATAYFRYDWVLKDQSTVSFDCVDVFDFDAAGLIEKLVIIYDTHTIRADLGDRFSRE
ncbi:nuclear transport factor 2 family protein [Aquitalea aquatica]|uniref:Nuclear transport factor 2 family protein n=1 Tax=Aquitalea aquatica TaxID=3044273 RepID=A0A838Y1B7_9NEIS|nr:nuclear transport factor 2 family protein [Aquitalea magnusonii]MBA4708446.1 nuclear transport factor 2 family protein [Aquitalea magnusonii]